MARGDELREEVGGQVDPPSLTYFAKVAELADWVDGDQEKRGRLEKRWRRDYDAHRKSRTARQKAERAAGRDGGR